MTASPSGSESLPPITAQLGRTGTHTLAFTNPLGADAAFSATATPGFSICPSSFVLGPYGGTDLVVEYVPGAIGVEERGSVTVASATAGSFQFECTGKVSWFCKQQACKRRGLRDMASQQGYV